MIRPASTKALPVKDIDLPEPLSDCRYCYVKHALLYEMEAVKPEYRSWFRWRVKNGKEHLEKIYVNAPGYLLRVSNDLLITPFFFNTSFYRRNADTILAASYHPLQENHETTTYFNALYFESRDDGMSFDMISSIRYLPPYKEIQDSEDCQGWLEPALCFLDEDTAFTLLRTTCVKGVGPLYISLSFDGCRTWSEPEYSDSVGVSPQAIRLENGVVLAGYGRPGLFIRAMRESNTMS